jgi:acyl-CoA hydrolase
VDLRSHAFYRGRGISGEEIVTEYGIVNLRGKSTKERAELLISIAHPNFRKGLWDHAKSINLI